MGEENPNHLIKMPYQFESGPTFPYPLRPSVFAEKEGAFKVEKSLDLSEEEKKVLLGFESGLFDELKEIKKIDKDTHEVYVGALMNNEGQRMVEVIYKKGRELMDWTKQEMTKYGLDVGDKDLLADVYEAVFQDIFGREKKEDEEGVHFKKFVEVIKEKTGKEEEIKKPIAKVESRFSVDEVIDIFSKLDLKTIPYRWRRNIHDYSSLWARETVKEQYRKSLGDVSKVENPRAICRLVAPSENKERLEKLKEFKIKVKNEQLKLSESEEKIDRAKVIVLDIYRKYTNWQIADDLLLWNAAGVEGKEIFKTNNRQAEGVDKFIHGVDESFDEAGNRNIMTDWMKKTVIEVESDKEGEVEEYRVNSDEQMLIANWMLKEYGYEKDWKVIKRKSSVGTMSVNSNSKKVFIPNDSDRGVMEFLSVISHEIEGHALSHENTEALNLKLKIMKKYSAGGRDSILEEAGAKNVEDITWKWMTGKEKKPESVYFRSLELKKNGGTFRDCLGLIAEMRAKKLGVGREKMFEDEETFEQIFNYAYDRAMRLFREHTPLDDDSGKITTSDQLKYLEQSKVTERLKKEGVEEVLYVNGFDLYSVKQLLELGVLDKTKVKRPKMVIINKLWPVLEKGLKGGKTVTEMMREM
ncbi:TPA: hypothetical protein DCP77_00870 [Candidatus Collierbacteria bacterium]|uniref:DUF1704 domain-containing protein n=1 Tax=Candidatus Collierbacteria bacterium GW2011_GWA2_42_17 TaxID=1618378 RepID=A0A0G0Z282_9BACT|nr:MAG: hypothetical protein UV06_C0004G0012 [Candidatus Collierbacteria bacterium GW2011_GWA2_42_17]KKS62987.1 MAG: hypothetical protein UV28_C0002G0010 [Candidatus Collierbacteria bacterium GW2011_GWE2_42_48]KKS63275.1 MAG: hypothetical protein UV29_C0004G0032 [Candidatus Collierbacteria bacterium GW2011_GWD2_42_50]KKS63317.1 MAG: hypothetical protein UV30_C0004G0030 [Candidatus Collierbacteria bacterium GW2011_GWF1_42_50]KKS67757.1 MAG: hypothetical protein UV37_C0002G0061 [Candidatus Collie